MQIFGIPNKYCQVFLKLGVGFASFLTGIAVRKKGLDPNYISPLVSSEIKKSSQCLKTWNCDMVYAFLICMAIQYIGAKGSGKKLVISPTKLELLKAMKI